MGLMFLNSWKMSAMKNIFQGTSFLFLVLGLLLNYGCFGLSFTIGDPPENTNLGSIAEKSQDSTKRVSVRSWTLAGR